jgi:hypothetical protein
MTTLIVRWFIRLALGTCLAGAIVVPIDLYFAHRHAHERANIYTVARANKLCTKTNSNPSGCVRCIGVIKVGDEYQPRLDYEPCSRGLAKAMGSFEIDKRPVRAGGVQ